MNALTNCLILLGFPAVMIVAGYWFARRLSNTSPAERLAAAALAGLCLLIWNVSLLGFFRPISGPWAWLCLWPLVLGLLDSRVRTGLWHDFSAVAFSRRGAIAALAGGLFLTALLWPLLSRPDLVFYDGTSNHDAFFWISGAEFLRNHTYMVEPVKSAVQPLTNGVGVFSGGWMPMWGRMSSEGLLALLAAVTGMPALQLYVTATVALFIPWVAATYLIARTFLTGRLTTLALVALCALQPLFIFFQSNANLPNLLGALTGAVVLVAMERALRKRTDHWGWLVLLALGLHGLLCSYPEMAPFVLLSAGLLWLRGGYSSERKPGWHPDWVLALAGAGGLLLNPVTSVRACSGFLRSFNSVRAYEIWPMLFRPLSPVEYTPALATMTLHTAADLGSVVAALCSVLLILVSLFVVWRAHDLFGALALVAGPGLLLVYTVATQFAYGWQKTAQFGGICSAAIFSVAAMDLLSRPAATRHFRYLARIACAGLGAFLLYATARNCFESHKWSQRKTITRDWFELREYAREHLQHVPVLVDAPHFSMPYFHGMWAIYFLADSYPLFPDGPQENGGYLRDYTRTESKAPAEPAQAFLVSARRAAGYDANSPRLFAGSSVVLLAEANRVNAVQGFSPATGIPEKASSHLQLDLRPHHSSQLILDLAPSSGSESHSLRWKVTCTVNRAQTYATEVSGAPPWQFAVPLAPDQSNHIEIEAADSPAALPPFPYIVTQLQVQSTR